MQGGAEHLLPSCSVPSAPTGMGALRDTFRKRLQPLRHPHAKHAWPGGRSRLIGTLGTDFLEATF